MKESRIIELLKSFSGEELSCFQKFLLSPYFTEGKKIRSRKTVEYFNILKNYHPEYNLESKDLFKKLYPDSVYKDNIIRKLNSDLLKLAENFLAQREFEQSELHKRRFLLKQLIKKNQKRVYEKNFYSILQFLDTLPKDEDYYYETYLSWLDYWGFFFGKKDMFNLKDMTGNINNFFIYVLLGSLRIYLWLLSFLNVVNKEKDLMMFEETLEYVKNNLPKFTDIPQILVYYYLIKLTTENDEKHFFILKEIGAKSFHALTEMDKQNFFIMMTNFCMGKINSGIIGYRKERFELDKQFLNFSSKSGNQMIHGFFMLAAAKNANILKKYDWSEKLLNKFGKFVSGDMKDFVSNYVKADICFHKKDFANSLINLSKIKTTYSNQKQYMKNLMIQIYYETSQFDSALYLIDSGKHFLKRDKRLKDDSRKSFFNFLKITEKLIRIKINHRSNDLDFLKNEILKEQPVYNKHWLLDKLNEIK